MWMVRAGNKNALIDEFKENSFVAIGWDKIGSLSDIPNPDVLKTKMMQAWPDYKPGKLIVSSGQLWRFKTEIKIGDKVVSYNKESREYLVGQIISDYYFDTSAESYKNHRKVRWDGVVSRDKLHVKAKNSLGSTLTLFYLDENVEREVLAALKGEEAIHSNPVQQEEEFDEIKADFIEKSREFISDKIAKLDWSAAQELVAGLIRAMGYKTRVSEEGPDRGRDIVASPDGLGLEDPRIIVEVKHREGKIGSQAIRSFTGGLRPGNKGLYVSTGGFSRDAFYEAERSNQPLTLVGSDMLVDLIIDYYDKMDLEARTLIPLQKIYWPINVE